MRSMAPSHLLHEVAIASRCSYRAAIVTWADFARNDALYLVNILRNQSGRPDVLFHSLISALDSSLYLSPREDAPMASP